MLTRKLCEADLFGYQPKLSYKMHAFWLVVCFISLSSSMKLGPDPMSRKGGGGGGTGRKGGTLLIKG